MVQTYVEVAHAVAVDDEDSRGPQREGGRGLPVGLLDRLAVVPRQRVVDAAERDGRQASEQRRGRDGESGRRTTTDNQKVKK